MSFMMRMAFRNALRNKRRSLFTIASLVLGVGLFVAAKSFVDGIEKTLVSTQIDSEHGHLRVVTKGYLLDEDYRPLDLKFDEAPGVAALLAQTFPTAQVERRAQFMAQIGDGVRTLNGRGLVVNPETYAKMFRIGALAMPAAGADGAAPKAWAWMGADLASAFGLKVGDRFFLKAKTRTGTVNAQDGVILAGLLQSGSAMTDNFTVIIPSSWGAKFLNLRREGETEEYATEIFARFANPDDAEAAEAAVLAAYPALDAETWRENTEYVRAFNDIRRQHFYLVVGIILLIGALSVANTSLMAAFERTKEIGTLLALGYRAASVRALFLTETLLIGAVGSLLGVVIGGTASAWFERYPIRLSGLDEVEGGMPMPPLLYFKLSPEALLYGFFIGLVVATVAALLPAVRASKLDPLTALREEA
ncbi:MAG: ABC transporter permease [Myxococcales bacterium]|nr:ABC transporter permease [Myxococcales bacterium]